MWRPSHTLKVAAHTHAQTGREQTRVVQHRRRMRTPAGGGVANLAEPAADQPEPADGPGPAGWLTGRAEPDRGRPEGWPRTRDHPSLRTRRLVPRAMDPLAQAERP